jgi:diguanylate cyclase (GGDEF)-like protein
VVPPLSSPIANPSGSQPTELERLQEENRRLQATVSQLEGLVYVDPLTGLSNRRYLETRLQQELAQHRRQGGSLSVLVLDLDGFKRLNDEHGHQEGDRALQWLGGFLRRTTRASDVCCRLGGDEFVVLLPGTATNEAALFAARLKRCAAEQDSPVGFSVGCATARRGDDSRQLLERADGAMYADKRSGAANVVVLAQRRERTRDRRVSDASVSFG